MKSTFYVWKENQDAYASVPKKQELINKLLRVYFDKQKLTPGLAMVKMAENPVKSGEAVTVPFVPKPPDPETGYPCCQKARPCRHWQWDGNKQAYVNELTGKEREAGI